MLVSVGIVVDIVIDIDVDVVVVIVVCHCQCCCHCHCLCHCCCHYHSLFLCICICIFTDFCLPRRSSTFARVDARCCTTPSHLERCIGPCPPLPLDPEGIHDGHGDIAHRGGVVASASGGAMCAPPPSQSFPGRCGESTEKYCLAPPLSLDPEGCAPENFPL